MVHTKTIFAIAIILIIQAKGNEIVLHRQGKDGSYNEFRKSESSLPGGVSKTVVITRRMLGSPVSNLNLFSSSLGGISKPGLSNYPISLQPSLGIHSQWNLPSPNVDSQWSSGSPWNVNHQSVSAPEWNLPSQNVDSQWSSGTPWNLNHQSLSAPQWNLPSQNVDNQWNSGSPWSQNHQSVSAPQWNLPPQNVENQWNSGALWNGNQQPASSSQWDLPSQPGANSALGLNYQSNNLPWNLPSQAGLLGINSQNNANLQSGLVSQPSGSGSLDGGNAPWNTNAQTHPSGSSQWYPPSSNSDLNPSSQSSLLAQWSAGPQQIDSSNYNPLVGVPSGSGASDQQSLISQIGGNSNYNPLLGAPSASGAGSQESLFSQLGGNPNINFNSGWNSNFVPGSSHQQGSWLVNRPLNVPQSSYLDQRPRVIPGQEQFLSQAVNGVPLAQQTSWGGNTSPSSPEKRSVDEEEKDSAEGHWLEK